MRVNTICKSSGWRGTLKRTTWLDLRCCGGVDFHLRNILIGETIEGLLDLYVSIESNSNCKQQIVSSKTEETMWLIWGDHSVVQHTIAVLDSIINIEKPTPRRAWATLSLSLASIVSKVFEKIIYDRIAYSLITCDNQFGFKAKHSTDMCIYMPSKRLY